MKVPICVPNITKIEEDYVVQAIRSTFVSSVGPFVDQFETLLCDEGGFEAATVVSSGTVAIKLALETVGVKPNDIVISPSLSFIATANAISHTGAKPYFVDVEKESWSIDLAKVEKFLEECEKNSDHELIHPKTGSRVSAIVPVLIMGAAIDFNAISKLARKFGLKTIVDAAAGIGVRGDRGEQLGAYDFDAVCYSFNGNKTITTGGGGAILSRDAHLIAKARHLATTGRVGNNYDHDVIAYNYRMTNIQAALGVAQFQRLSEFLEKKKEISKIYEEFSSQYSSIRPFPVTGYGRDTHWFSGFYYVGEDQDVPHKFLEFMSTNGVDLRKFWKPLHLQLPYLQHMKSEMDVCEDLWERIFTMPCSTNISPAEIDQVLSLSNRFWKQYG